MRLAFQSNLSIALLALPQRMYMTDTSTFTYINRSIDIESIVVFVCLTGALTAARHGRLPVDYPGRRLQLP